MDKLRIVYLAGPGDAASVLRTIAAGETFDSIAHVPYSELAFRTSQKFDADILAIAANPRADDFSFENMRSINIPDPLRGKKRLAYHMGNVTYANAVRQHVKDFRANVLINGPLPYPFLTEGLAKEGVSMYPALHATLLPEFLEPSKLRKLAVRLSKRFYSKTATAVLSHPGITVRQVHDLTGNNSRPIVEFLPLLRADAFPGCEPPKYDPEMFRVMTVGRVVREKGIFDLIEVARQCREKLDGRIRFDVCGAGPALEEARQHVIDTGLEDTMTLHGWTEMDDMARLWGESHVAVVPTNSGFTEGFNQVVIEAVLAGRPVITSRVCPALEYVRPCSIEVEVNDIQGYVDQVVKLATNREAYEALQSTTGDVIKPFLDPGNSFSAALEHCLNALLEGREVTPVSHPPADWEQLK